MRLNPRIAGPRCYARPTSKKGFWKTLMLQWDGMECLGRIGRQIPGPGPRFPVQGRLGPKLDANGTQYGPKGH